MLPKKYTISWEELEKSSIFHDILSFIMSSNDIKGYLVKKYFRSIRFLNHVIFKIAAWFYRPIFEALELPIDKRISPKPNIFQIYIV